MRRPTRTTTLMPLMLLLGALVAAGAFAADPTTVCSSAPMAGTDLMIRGSTTLRPVSTRAVSLFNDVYSDVIVHQDAYGSSQGIRALIEGACAARSLPVAGCDINGDGKLESLAADVAQSSRKINATESNRATASGLCVVEHVAALDGLGIIVNTGNNVVRLNAPDIKFIYENNMTGLTWQALGLGNSTANVVPVSRTTEGGTFGSFLDLYGVSQTQLLANTSVVYTGSNDEVVEAVRTTPGAIGYIGIAFQTPVVRNVPVAKTAGDPAVLASFETVQNGTFQFSRKLYAYTIGVPPAGDPRADWLEYLQSRLGQAHVYEAGYVPVVPSSPIAPVAQLLLEPHVDFMLTQDSSNIQGRLSMVADAKAKLADSDPANDANAKTDLTESQFALEEYYANDNRVVRTLLDRAAASIASCVGLALTGQEHVATAEADWTAAQNALSACDPLFPPTCTLDAYNNWLASLNLAFAHGAAAVAECTGIDPLAGNESDQCTDKCGSKFDKCMDRCEDRRDSDEESDAFGPRRR